MKQFTRNRNRRLTARQKKIVHAAGHDPALYFLGGENVRYLFLMDRETGEPALAVEKPQK